MSRLPRFFIAPEQVQGGTITIAGEDIRHIAVVLRMRTGDELLLCDGSGKEYTAAISRIGKKEVTAEIVRRMRRDSAIPRITLCQGLPKADKMDWIVQKATELGAAEIVPIITERTVVKIKDGEKKIARWRKIAREAAMQSDRTDLPVIGAIVPFGERVRARAASAGTLGVMPWEESTDPVKAVLRSAPNARHITVLIGPEGGFSAVEAALAREAGFHTASLGRNILRTETAAIAVLSMIAYEYGTE